MTQYANGHSHERTTRKLPPDLGQIVLVFQGGGALGAYQAGVYHALHKAGIEPDWIIGTSIGAINASLIAGNRPERRLEALSEFWRRVTIRSAISALALPPALSQSIAYWSTVAGGLPAFFEPNPWAFASTFMPLDPEGAGYYSTTPLERTLGDLVDFARIGRTGPRLTVGAAHVRSSRMRYFDSKNERLGVRHILASGALPPAFPPVRIDGELYWDGGILSNTPTEVVFDDEPRRSSLIFAVHMWNPEGPEPRTMAEVSHRQKDVQYSSRVASHIARQKQMHRLRHVITELVSQLPPAGRDCADVRALAAYGCVTRMHVVRLLAPSLAHEDQTKDVDFSARSIRMRWQAGFEHTCRAIERAPWEGDFDPLEGVILHEQPGGSALAPETDTLREHPAHTDRTAEAGNAVWRGISMPHRA